MMEGSALNAVHDTACPYIGVRISPEPYRADIVCRQEPVIVDELDTCYEPIVS
jgi:hypothetical protein